MTETGGLVNIPPVTDHWPGSPILTAAFSPAILWFRNRTRAETCRQNIPGQQMKLVMGRSVGAIGLRAICGGWWRVRRLITQ
jgi:hypothetical protein